MDKMDRYEKFSLAACRARIAELEMELESWKVRHQDEVNARVNAEDDLYAMGQERRREHDLRVKINNEAETLRDAHRIAVDRHSVTLNELTAARSALIAERTRREGLEARIRELEAENTRLNMEMAAYRQGCTRADAEAMMAVKDALEAEKEASKERRHSTDSRCPNMMHKRYAMLNCTSTAHAHVGAVTIDRGETCTVCGKDMNDPIHIFA